jgi:drug/metabolite transporter (DMT)-like permease
VGAGRPGRLTALLALLSAVLIGTADFFGGMTSRSYNGVRVAALVSLAGLPPALLLAALWGADHVTRADVGWSAAAGVAVALGIGCFYVGMGRGLISVVAPVAAVIGAIVPVVYALVRGERPGPVAVAGLVIAFVAVAVVSLAPSEQHPDHEAVVDGAVIALALTAGLLFGLFYVSFSRVSDDAGMWPVAIERAAATIVLLGLVVPLTSGPMTGVRRIVPAVVVIGALEIAATVPLLLALQRGPVSVASVVASLYPVTTVLLAGIVLHERLSRLQYAGVLCALVSVVLVSSG